MKKYRAKSIENYLGKEKFEELAKREVPNTINIKKGDYVYGEYRQIDNIDYIYLGDISAINYSGNDFWHEYIIKIDKNTLEEIKNG